MVHGEIFLQFMQLESKAVFFNSYLDSIENMFPIISSLGLARLFHLEILHLDIVKKPYGVRKTIERVVEKDGN
jgi:hypothetical protein